MLSKQSDKVISPMRGTDIHQESMFSYVSPENLVPKNHPLRPIRKMVDAALDNVRYFSHILRGGGSELV